jgi:hypothetical protein
MINMYIFNPKQRMRFKCLANNIKNIYLRISISSGLKCFSHTCNFPSFICLRRSLSITLSRVIMASNFFRHSTLFLFTLERPGIANKLIPLCFFLRETVQQNIEQFAPGMQRNLILFESTVLFVCLFPPKLSSCVHPFLHATTVKIKHNILL